MDTRLLEEIGLTPGEIKTYLALLRIGMTSTGPLAKESGVSRSKLYGILDKLEKKGLAGHIKKAKTVQYQAVEPSKIRDYISHRQEELKKIEEGFSGLLPQLEAYQHEGSTTQAIVYQGLKGIATAHEHTYLKLKRGETFCYLGINKDQPTTHHLYWQRDHLRRAKAGILCKLLFNNDTDPAILKNRNSYKGCDARFMPTELKTPAYFLIYKDTVMIGIAQSALAIEIISKDIADSFMAYFEAFWKMSKKFK